MILTVERALIERLKRGLGCSVKAVEPYGGQLDEAGLSNVVNSMPALYVSFVGHKNPKNKDTAGKRLHLPASYTVFVVTRNVASEAAGRHGTAREVGAYQLIEAVRRLLVGQRFGLGIDRVQAGSVQLLGNIKVGSNGLTAYGCEFLTGWDEEVLGDGFPRADDPVMAGLEGERAEEPPDLLRIVGHYDVGANGSVEVVDVVTVQQPPPN